ncbi:MAG TPA: hypothetical protein GXZ87_03810 [Bacteroidales bacterium]|nr:hypothetical protein [Bacteroidales bacterium]
MKTLKKAVLFSCVVLMVISCGASKKAVVDTDSFRYEIVCQGVGTQGSNLIKVFSYSKKPNVAIESAKKNAVHGILFKGFTGANGCAPQRALVSPAVYEQNRSFFDNFFAENGNYSRYVSLSSDGSIDAKDRLKVGNEYKIGVVVSVNIASLRRDLESAGIIKKLSSGF